MARQKVGFIQTIAKSEFIRHNAVFFVGSIAIGALNYLYYPVLGRLMEPTAFGEVQTLVTLFLQAAIFLVVMGNLTVNIVANYGTKKFAQKTLFELEKLALLVGVFAVLLTVLAGPLLQRFFQFDSFVPFVLLAVALLALVPSVFRMGYLRGVQAFGSVSIAGFIGALAKLLLSVAFVVAGYGVVGAMVGLVIAQAVTSLYSAVQARAHGLTYSLRQIDLRRLPDMRLLRPELKYAALVLVCSLSITALYSIDIVAVKHYFSAREAGLYAGIATVARVLFFLTGSISQVLLPMVKLSNTKQQNRKALAKSSALMSLIGGAALVVFWLRPEFVVKTMMGDEYVAYAWLLPRLALVVFLASLVNLIVLYYMALRRYAIGYISLASLIATIYFVFAGHSSLLAVVNAMLYGVICFALLIAGWLLLGGGDRKHDPVVHKPGLGDGVEASV